MYQKFRYPNSLNNQALFSIVNQARELSDSDYWKNGKAVLVLLKKIVSKAKQEKEWYLYLETLCQILNHENNFGTNQNVLRYAKIFLRDSALYYEKALKKYPNSPLFVSIMTSYEEIFYVLRLYANSEWDFFWQYFETISKQCGSDIHYWKCRLEFALLNRNLSLANQAYDKLQKQNINYSNICYTCLWRIIEGYYILIDDPEQALLICNRILSRRLPQKAMWSYDICHNTSVKRQYFSLLHFSVITGNRKAYTQFLPYFPVPNCPDAIYTFDAYIYASSENFSALEAAVKVAAEDAEQLSDFSEWDGMEYMLSWMAYFKKYAKTGQTAIKICCNAHGFPAADENGKCSVEQMVLWFEEKADEIGARFEKNWKDFHYQPLKSSFYQCIGLDS